ncbi:type IV secretion system protein [Cohaesibacter haloalkalitolerans]|uniref:type IV secretion system protein n=1 Tax=Cohaesibacter haloalkalitolerans TaxID=1162980 RepID=UPI000E65951F|nr:type IV secretion system protein [Cohaesibacter haloalkalitolerans]
MDCTTCTVFEAFVNNSSGFVDQMVSNVEGPLTGLVIAIATVWIVWVGIQVVLGSLDVPHAVKQVVFMVLGFGAFLGVDAIIGTVFDTAISVLGGLSASITGYSGDGASGISSLLMAIESQISKVVTIVAIFIGDGSGTPWGVVAYVMRAIYGVLLLIPYGLLLILFLAQTATCLFRVTLICGLSPFIVALSGFPFGSGLYAQAIRTLISAIATMLAVTLVFSIVTKCFDILNIGGESSLSPEEFASLSSGPYLLALIMGWLGCALMSEAISISGSIAGAMLGSVGASTLAGRTLGAGAAAGGVGVGITKYAGSKALDGAKSGYEKYKNRKRPGEISTPTE